MSTIASLQEIQAHPSQLSSQLKRITVINPRSYVSESAFHSTRNKTAIIVSTTIVGTGIGASVGAAGAGIGVIPGAVLGGSLGFATGVVITAKRDVNKFKKWRDQQKKEDVAALFKNLTTLFKTDQFECAISHDIAVDPVVGPHTDHIYDREQLERWVRDHGTDPMTRQPVSLEDIQHAPSALGFLNKKCKEIIDHKIEGLSLTPKEMEGIRLMRADFEVEIKDYFKAETEACLKKFQNGQISAQAFAAKMKELADAIEPK